MAVGTVRRITDARFRPRDSRAGAGGARVAAAVLAVAGLALAPLACGQRAATTAAFVPAAFTPVAATTPVPALGDRVTVLLLDMSGSMGGGNGNDPNDARCAAAETFIGLSQPNEYVGLIGFADAAELWSKPIETTPEGRQQLLDILARRCHARGNTATFDALALAYHELAAAATSGSGAVVLLTDGTPEPDTDGQIRRIQQQLVPGFVSHGWPVHTVPLGTTATRFDFLRTLSASTAGRYYDQIQGRKATALDLLPLYVEILRDQVGRTPGLEVPATTLQGGTRTLELPVTPYAKSLDVVVVYDPQLSVRLRTPQGADVAPVPMGTHAQRYGAIFAVDQPVSGSVPWTLEISGSGRFRVETLTVSRLRIAIEEPTSVWLPIGQPLTVVAGLEYLNGQPAPDSLALVGSLEYAGGGKDALPIDLTRTGARYRGVVPVPTDARPGAYQIVVHAAQTSLATLVTEGRRGVRLDAVPIPTLAGSGGTATSWPSWVRIYDLPVLDGFRGWALGGLPADPTAVLSGTVHGPDGALYTRGATVTASVYAPGAASPAPAQASASRSGAIRVAFAAAVPGMYRIRFLTGGSPADTFGDRSESTQSVRVEVRDATAEQVRRAGAATVLVGVLLVLLLLLLGVVVRFSLLRPPYGMVELGRSTAILRRGRHPLRALAARNVLRSEHLGLPPGARFVFRYRDGIVVQSAGGARPRHSVRAEIGAAVRFRWRAMGLAGLTLGLATLAYGARSGASWLELAGVLALLLGVAYGLPGLVTPLRRTEPPPVRRRPAARTDRGQLPARRGHGPRA